MAGHARSFKQFVVERIAGDGALGGQRFAHEARRVDDFDGFLGGEARDYEFAPSGKAEHQVLLDEAERDVQIGCHESLVDVDRRSAPGSAKRAVRSQVARVVTDDAVLAGNLRPGNDFNFFGRRGAVQPGGDRGWLRLRREFRRRAGARAREAA